MTSASLRDAGIVFVFSGHGSQWPRMGCGLFSEPAFRGAIERWDRAIRRQAGWSLLRELAAPAGRSRLGAVEIAQPAIVAVQSALAELWRARGLAAEAVVGYSIGDVAACCSAGVLSVEDAARVICRQGELLRRLRGRGRMLAVELAPTAARELPAVRLGLVAVAVEGGPRSAVLSGDPAALEEVRAALAAQGVFCRWVATDVACHSPQVEAVCAELAESLADLAPRATALPVYAGLTGGVLPGSAFGAAYWARSLREPVRLAAAVERLAQRGNGVFLEVSPHPLLLPMIREGLAAQNREAVVLPSLRRGEDEPAALEETLEALAAAGRSEEPALTRGALLAAAPTERRRLLEDEILRLAAAVLRTPVVAALPLVRSGLDSLGALEIRHRLEPLLGCAVSTAALLGDRSPRELSGALVEGLHGHSRTSTDTHGPRDENPARRPCSPCSSVCVRVSAGESPPLSRGQKALWFLHCLAPESPAYHVAVALRVLSPLDAGALERALLALAARHPALRAVIHAPEGAPEQRIDPRPRVDFRAFDAAGWAAVEVDRALHGEAWRPFDLEAGPPLRAALFSRGGDGVLLLALHHAVADFWSLAVLVRELGQLYLQESGGPAALPALPDDLAAPVRRQEELLAGPEGERLWSWWRDQLAGAPVLDLPTDRPRPAAQSFRGASQCLLLDAPLAAGLRAVAHGHGATLFMVLMTAFQALLHRAGGQTDLPVGTPTAGRDRSAMAGLIGYFVNPVVLRGDLTGDPGFAAALDRTRRTALAAFEHQDYPFPLLVERLQPRRDPSRSPLFQAMLILEQAPRPEEQGLAAALAGQAGVAVRLGGLAAETVRLREEAAQFDLTLVAAETAGTLAVALQHSTDLFDGTTALRLLAAFRALVAAAVADPRRPISALPLLAAAERHQLLREWNDTAAGPAADLCLHELIAAQAARTPDAVAVEAGGRTLTWAGIEERSSALARRLHALGVGVETRVGVCLERRVDLPVALLAILKTGGAYVPLDSAYPAERLRLVVEDSGASLILTEDALLDRLPPQGPPRICLEQLAATADGRDGETPAVSSDNLAYVLYTSGSTGRPKGVQITHRAVVAFLRSMARRPGMTAGDTLLAVTTLCFDIAGLELFLPLAVGARVVLASRATASDPGRLAAALAASRATVMQATPATWRMLAASGWSPEPGLTVLCGGEALPPELAAGLTAGGAALWNLYGPTETTIWSSVQRVDCVEQGSGPLPIGRPIDGTALHVLDPLGGGEPVPVGWEGELAIAGAGLSRGYLGQPDRTAERFVPDPWGAPGARLYRTGDRVRRLADGAVRYLGRADFQVKVRGFRIEPGEVEAHLVRHPAVAAAVVDAPAANGGERRLTAWIVARTASALPPAGELRAFLLERLPEPMVPSLFVPLDRLPLTPNGKVDRRALPAPDGARPDLVAAYAPPRGRDEEALVWIWEKVLGLERVGRDDNFFEAGGDSIRALQVVFQARREGLDLVPGDLFVHRTPAELATAASRRPHPPGPPLPSPSQPPGEGGMVALSDLDQERLLALGFDPAGIEDLYPLSPLQQGMLLHSLAAPGAGVYCQQLDWRLRGDLDTAAFLAAWRHLARRHAVLRSSLLWEGLETPLQAVHRHVELPWQEHDWRHLPPHRQEEELAALRAADRARGFDAARPPLLRLTLVRLDDHEHRFLWTHHHLLLDGWSLQILHAELLAAYDALSPHPRPLSHPLPPPGRGAPPPTQDQDFPLSRAVGGGWERGSGGEGPPRPYRDYIAWLAAQDRGAAEAFWRGALAGISAPPDLARAGGGAKREARLTLPAAASASLASWARRRQLTLSTLAQAAWAVLLARGSGEADVLFGVTTSGRPTALPGADSMVGLLINTLPLRVRVEAGAPLLPWLHRLQADQAEARRYEHCSLTDIQKWSPVAPPQPLFESLLVFESYPRSAALRGSTLTLDDLRFTESTNYPVTVIVTPGEEISLQLSYDPACLDGAAAGRLLAHLAVLLAGIAAETAATPDLLPLLGESERHQVLVEWNDTWRERRPLPAEPVLHQLFCEQAARTPAAVAVEHEGRSLTYRELDRWSDCLADRFLRCGVAPETRVAVCAERSLELVAALLGVLKAGAAYVPLDPSYPADRLAYLLADAGAPVLLVQGRLLASLPESRARVLLLDQTERTEPSDRSDATASTPRVPVDGDQLAYVIYTSGSTGNPKGAMNTHRAIVNRLLWMQEEYRLTAADAVLQKTPVSFDVSVWELFWPLLTGARLVMARPGGHLDPAYLAETVAAAGITTLHFVPSMLPAFLDQPGLGRCTRLRRLICSGETLPPDLCRRALERLPAAAVHNLYGPTEAAVDVTFHACREGHGRARTNTDEQGQVGSRDASVSVREGPCSSVATTTIPIGRPIDNTRIVLLDRGGLPVPVGVPGELHIGGVNLARGYHGQPVRTAASFVPDPSASRPGERLYRTGDLARLRPDGAIEHLGRIDHQVKVRGVRIEPGEIEAVLLAHPGVRAAVVTVREDAPGVRRLVAYAVPMDGGAPAVAALRDLCRRRLPAALVPSAFVFLAALPVTPNGKLDRKALPRPPVAGSGGTAAFAGPGPGIESALAAIWQETLHVDRVGLHDSFFDLGGHSLLLFRVQGLVQERCGRRIAPLDLFRYPTIAALARQLSGAAEDRLEAVPRPGRLQLARQRDCRQALRTAAAGGRP